MNPKGILLTTLVIVTQLSEIHSSPPNQSTLSDDSNKSSNLYLFGGNDGKHNALDSASRLKNGEWTMMNNMPAQKQGFCGAVIDKQIYLFGGQTHNGTNTRFWDSAEVYDSLQDTYTFLPSIPEQRSFCAAAAFNNSVYVVGGLAKETINGGGSVSTSFDGKLFRYDIGTNQWNTLAKMRWSRYGHQLVELDGLLYAVGCYKTFEVYNPTTDRWSSLAETNIVHYNLGAVAHQGDIYVLSPFGFERYWKWLNEWRVLNAPAIVKNGGRSLVSMDGKLWAIGGEITGNVTRGNTVYTYDPVTSLWTKQRNMDIPRKFHGAFVVNN